MEAAMATSAGPSGLTAAAAGGRGGAAAAASGTDGTAGSNAAPAGTAAFLSLPAPFSEEDEADVHKCGRCQAEFSSLEEFVQHKLQKCCQRAPEPLTAAPGELLGPEVQKVVPAVEEAITVAHIVVEASSIAEEIGNAAAIVGSGHIKEVIVAGDHVFENPNGHLDGEVSEEQGNPEEQEQEQEQEVATELIKVKLLVNKEGRYVCELCQKTFKTASILKAHMITHSSRKDYECKLCGTSFRTKGSLIRHHRRHTDERPYRCKKCGKSFRESGALTRHLKSLTPCTEKICFNMNKEIVVKEDLPAGSSGSNTDTVAVSSEAMEPSPVIHLVTDAKGNVLREVHVQMQELPVVDAKPLDQESHPEELPCEGEVNSENLLRQAMRNSGIVIERVAVEELQKPDEPPVAATEELGNDVVEAEEEPCGEQCVEVEQTELTDAERTNGYKSYVCPQCDEAFSEAASLEAHIKGHLDYKPFKCEECGKEFTKGYLLKKHQEVHVNERRFRCGECGKLYKTIAHVKGHQRVHSDERPYSCPKCGKRYKTKNAQQVHFRTHLEDKPYVCQFCSRGFREKGSLVRHIRHHTGEKPFKCYKCGRGFAEHGTLNRHLKTKGGCLLALKEVEEAMVSEESQSADNLAATVISEDPHTVLVEFSSVVADTQDYIIETATEDMETSEATEIIEGTRHEVDSHIMKVVQQIVNQANSGHQIIVQNVTVAENSEVSTDTADTITIATPESLTEQVAMTLASAIGEGAVLATEGSIETEEATVTMVASEDIEIMEHGGDFVIATQEGEVEVQTVIV